jgi:uncharacterized protein (DUF433 family)
MSGAPCFSGTRVPVQTLFDYLSHGHPLDEFLEDFPTVTRDQALAVVKLAGDRPARPLRDRGVRVFARRMRTGPPGALLPGHDVKPRRAWGGPASAVGRAIESPARPRATSCGEC